MEASSRIGSDVTHTATPYAAPVLLVRFSLPVGAHRGVYNHRMSPTAPPSTAVALGIERLLEIDRPLVTGRRVGLVCNPASIDGGFRHSSDRLAEDPDVTLAALFGPQHGFRSDLQ